MVKTLKGLKMERCETLGGSKFATNGIMYERFFLSLFQKRIKGIFLFVILMVYKDSAVFVNVRASARGEVKQEKIVPRLRRISIVACRTGGHFLARIYGTKEYGERDLLGKDLPQGITCPRQWR